MSDRLARIVVSADYLQGALILPDGAEIVGVRSTDVIGEIDEVEFVVRSSELPEVMDGEEIPVRGWLIRTWSEFVP